LQAGEILSGLTPKEHDWVVHKVKQLRWEGDTLFQVWTNVNGASP